MTKKIAVQEIRRGYQAWRIGKYKGCEDKAFYCDDSDNVSGTNCKCYKQSDDIPATS